MSITDSVWIDDKILSLVIAAYPGKQRLVDCHDGWQTKHYRQNIKISLYSYFVDVVFPNAVYTSKITNETFQIYRTFGQWKDPDYEWVEFEVEYKDSHVVGVRYKDNAPPLRASA